VCLLRMVGHSLSLAEGFRSSLGCLQCLSQDGEAQGWAGKMRGPVRDFKIDPVSLHKYKIINSSNIYIYIS
jgi:hypothetical protein